MQILYHGLKYWVKIFHLSSEGFNIILQFLRVPSVFKMRIEVLSNVREKLILYQGKNYDLISQQH